MHPRIVFLEAFLLLTLNNLQDRSTRTLSCGAIDFCHADDASDVAFSRLTLKAGMWFSFRYICAVDTDKGIPSTELAIVRAHVDHFFVRASRMHRTALAALLALIPV